jgi:Spy/CpxP family protein refolding chaperone
MKLTKIVIILLLAAQFAAAQLVCAQDSPTPTPTVAPMLLPTSKSLGKPSMSDMLSRKLSLTAAQKAQLQPCFDAVQLGVNTAHQQEREDENVLLKQLCSSIRPSLTPQQQNKLDAFTAKRIERQPPSNPFGIGAMFGRDLSGAL